MHIKNCHKILILNYKWIFANKIFNRYAYYV